MEEESKQKFTLKMIPTKLEKDINHTLSHYFKNVSTLSSMYWPRALRTFLAVLLAKVKPIDSLLTKLQWSSDYVDGLITTLESSSQTSIHENDRQQLGNLLRELNLHWPDYRISIRPVIQPDIDIKAGNVQWPTDIANYLDLYTTVNSVDVRSDVKNFLHCIMASATDGKVGYKIVYDVADKDPNESINQFYPIRIYTDCVDCTSRVREMLATESEALKQCINNLLPTDLVCVDTTTQALSGGVKSEM